MKGIPNSEDLPVLDLELEPFNLGASPIFQELRATRVDIRSLLVEDVIGSDRTANLLLNENERKERILNQVCKMDDVMRFY